MPRVFLCHSSKDKEFVERIALQLKEARLDVWYDNWEILIGDSIIEKIQDGIERSDFLVIVLSKSSVRSKWVRKEIGAGLDKEIKRKGAFVLPLLLENCNIPPLLRDKNMQIIWILLKML